MWEVFRDLLTTLLALVLVLVLAWLALRWLNRRVPGMGGGSTERLIKVLDRVTVGKNTVLVLVQVKNTVMLVAVGDHTVEKLAEFDAADGAFDIPKAAQQNPSFADALKDTLAKSRFGGTRKQNTGAEHLDIEALIAQEEKAVPGAEAPDTWAKAEAFSERQSAAEDTGGEDERHEE
ncbi:flagellar biosynthetic protein FliO [Ruminococcaceae bacterium OttesenSCG-928-D13]|nr:flagellar biosynthetic protein FliO [Ruminococcaceae bacterium OttesenSCG-928-D13]